MPHRSQMALVDAARDLARAAVDVVDAAGRLARASGADEASLDAARASIRAAQRAFEIEDAQRGVVTPAQALDVALLALHEAQEALATARGVSQAAAAGAP